MLDAYSILQFKEIQNSIIEFSKTEGGKSLVLNMKMSNNREDVIKSLDELKEMMDLISRYSYLPLTSSVHILSLIEIAKKTALLTPTDLNHVLNDIEISEKIIAHFAKAVGDFPLLTGYISSLKELSSLKKAIKKVITPSLTVSDNASIALKEIRQKIRSLEASLNSKVSSIAYTYSSYLSDKNVTIREGHFVLPVKTGFKNKVLGIIYDISDSGATTFIEPLELV